MREAPQTAHSRRLRRLTVIWVAVTVVTAPISYGILLAVTLPVLSALLGELFVGGTDAKARSTAWLVGPTLLVGLVWFGGRADERPIEGVIAGSMIALAVVALIRLRRISRTSRSIAVDRSDT